MAKGMGPHRPADGWLLRWSRQAVDLATRSIEPFLVLFAYSLTAGLSCLLAIGLAPTIWTFVLMTALMTSAGLFVVVYIMNVLMRQDGYPGIPLRDILRRSGDVAHVFFLVSSVTMLIALVLPQMVPRPESGTVTGMVNTSFLEIVLAEGLRAAIGVLVCGIVVNPFWVAIIPGTGMSFQEARLTGIRMMLSMMLVWIGICAFIIYFGSFLIRMPVWISLPGAVFMFAWVYVGAREVFGGIDENGSRQTALKPAF